MPYPLAAARSKGFVMRALLPYTFDPSVIPDGGLPSPLVGPTMAIASGVVNNLSSTKGPELLTDPGLEANYTAGKCDTLTTVSGTPTYLDGAPDVQAGSHSQSMANGASGDGFRWPTVTADIGGWYFASIYHKRTGGAGNGPLTQLIAPAYGLPYAYSIRNNQSATWAQTQHGLIMTAAAAMTLNPVQYGAGMTVLYDTASLKKVINNTQYALVSTLNADVTIELAFSAYDLPAGIIARADSTMQNFIFATLSDTRSGYTATCQVSLIKYVAGTPSNVIALATVTFVAGQKLKVVTSGTTVQMFYNNVQIGTDQTIATGATNTIHGFAMMGGAERVTTFSVT